MGHPIRFLHLLNKNVDQNHYCNLKICPSILTIVTNIFLRIKNTPLHYFQILATRNTEKWLQLKKRKKPERSPTPEQRLIHFKRTDYLLESISPNKEMERKKGGGTTRESALRAIVTPLLKVQLANDRSFTLVTHVWRITLRCVRLMHSRWHRHSKRIPGVHFIFTLILDKTRQVRVKKKKKEKGQRAKKQRAKKWKLQECSK